jgi:hypothetical protein
MIPHALPFAPVWIRPYCECRVREAVVSIVPTTGLGFNWPAHMEMVSNGCRTKLSISLPQSYKFYLLLRSRTLTHYRFLYIGNVPSRA